MSKRLKTAVVEHQRLPSVIWTVVVAQFLDWQQLAALSQTCKWWRDVVEARIDRRVAPAVAVHRQLSANRAVQPVVLSEVIDRIACSIWLGGPSLWLEFGDFRAGRSFHILFFVASVCRAGAALDVTIGVGGPAEIDVQMRALQFLLPVPAQIELHEIRAGAIRARFISVADTSVVLDNSVLLLSGYITDDHVKNGHHPCVSRLLSEVHRRRGVVVGTCRPGQDDLQNRIRCTDVMAPQRPPCSSAFRLLQHRLSRDGQCTV